MQRCYTEAELSRVRRYRAIAQRLEVSHATVSREIQRNQLPAVGYDARLAHRTAIDRRRRASARPRKVKPRHLDHIYDRLLEGQSPDVIAHRTSNPSLKLWSAWIYELLAREVAAGDDERVTLLERSQAGSLTIYAEHVAAAVEATS